MDTEISQSARFVIQRPPYATGSYDVTHTDEGLLRYFWGQGCKSMLDVGCGPGGNVELAKEIGFRALGVEVDPVFYRRMHIVLADCCINPFLLPESVDLVWSNEVAEHIPSSCIQNYLITLTENAREFICMTANQKPGPLHISVHPVEWWREKMAALGWMIHPDSVYIIRKNSTMDREFMRETGTIFVRSS